MNIDELIIDHRKAEKKIEQALFEFSAKYQHKFKITGAAINTFSSTMRVVCPATGEERGMITVGLQIKF